MDDIPLAGRHNPVIAKLRQDKTGRVLQDWQQVKTLEGESIEPEGAGNLLQGKIQGRSPAQEFSPYNGVKMVFRKNRRAIIKFLI